MNTNILTVSQLNFYVKALLESDGNLRSIYLMGEISNLTDHYRSGHIYLTLKDEKCSIKAVMFAGNARSLKFKPQDGMTVLVRGRVSIYDTAGTYQLYIEDMQPDGIGALNLAFEQLKKKLSEEGIFDESHKKPLPAFPSRIGVITSPTGAAFQDICRILKRRYPMGEIVLCPVLVQGENAAPQLTEAVRKFNRLKCADVIIIGRGGGSIEDLWAFNDEVLARAVYASEIPIVSAVGHETDFTICDFAADVRASTPSVGAELVSPESEILKETILYNQRYIREIVLKSINSKKKILDSILKSKVLHSPMEVINYRRIKMDMLTSGIKSSYLAIFAKKSKQFTGISAKLDALSPLKVLSRGYSITLTRSNSVIKTKNDVNINDEIEIIVTDGRISCTVNDIRGNDDEKEA